MASAAVIYDTRTLVVIAEYDNTLIAVRMLRNAIERGWKLQGRKYRKEWLEQMAVTTAYDHRTHLDHDVEVQSLMNGATVVIKQSQRGNPVYDPSMEGYWSM